MSGSDERRISYLPALDSLRAVAVMAVVAFHSGILRGGWLGVEIFFVLSGFLITTLLATEFQSSGTVRLLGFWLRRLRRLLPAIGAFLILIVVLALIGQTELRVSGLAGTATYTNNWVQIFSDGPGYWDEFIARDPTEHLWSLAIEEQVYLLWPIVVWFVARRYGLTVLLQITTILCGLSWGLAAFGALSDWSVNRLYLGTDTRCAAFLVGATLGLGRVGAASDMERLRTFAKDPLWFAVAGGVTVGALGFLRGDTRDIFLGPLAIVALATGWVVLSAAEITEGPLTAAWVRRIGQWSYGIYVYHWPIAQMDAVKDLPGVAKFVIVAATSTALAAWSYRLVEQPIRHRTGRPEFTAALAFAGFAALVVGVVVSTPAGPALAQLDPIAPRQTVASTTASSAPSASSPGSVVSPPSVASTQPPPAPLRVLVVGDSVPALAARQLVDEAMRQGTLMDVYALPGCVMSFDPNEQLDPKRCTEYLESIDERAVQSDPDVVVVWWGGTGATLKNGNERELLCSDAGRSTVTSRLAAMVAVFANATPRAQVAIATPSQRLDQESDGPQGTLCEVDTITAFATANEVEVIAVGSFVCPSYPTDCERVPRRDGLHYTDDGATIVAGFLLEQLELLAA